MKRKEERKVKTNGGQNDYSLQHSNVNDRKSQHMHTAIEMDP